MPLPQTNAAVNNYTYSPSKTQDDDSFDVRIDHRFRQADSLFGRYSFNNTTTIVPELFPSVNGVNVGGGPNFPGTAKQRAQQLGVGWNHTATAGLLLEVKGGFSRYNADTVPTNYNQNVSEQVGIPGINFDADSSGLVRLPIAGYFTLGDATFIPLLNENTVLPGPRQPHLSSGRAHAQGGRRRQVPGFLRVPKQSGTRSVLVQRQLHERPGGRQAPAIRLPRSCSVPSATLRTKYLAEPTYSANELSGYVQDDWRTRPWLTLNLGLRYDYYPPLTEADNQISNVDLSASVIRSAGEAGFSESAGVKPDHGNISPRVGFAATLNKNTVVRGGYALSFSPPFVGTPLAFGIRRSSAWSTSALRPSLQSIDCPRGCQRSHRQTQPIRAEI